MISCGCMHSMYKQKNEYVFKQMNNFWLAAYKRILLTDQIYIVTLYLQIPSHELKINDTQIHVYCNSVHYVSIE